MRLKLIPERELNRLKPKEQLGRFSLFDNAFKLIVQARSDTPLQADVHAYHFMPPDIQGYPRRL